MNDVRVRKAFNLAIDKFALAASRRTVKPITAFTPPGLFPGYESPRGDDFDPARAVQLLAEAGFRDERGAYDSSKFPVAEVEIAANVIPSNREVAEFIQAQWKQNLGITVPIRMMESKTINAARARLEYKGLTRNGFAADYLDPFTFLNIFTAPNNGTGWFDARYNTMLERANRAATPAERFRLLAEAEKYLIDAQPVIPLYSSATNAMKKPYVQGLYPNAGMLHAWKFVRIEPDAAKWE
jgi:oligopeptide transport system substrate-binding protein